MYDDKRLPEHGRRVAVDRQAEFQMGMEANIDGAERDVIQRYFAAMRIGASALEDLLQLFADDAVYVEPFNGPAATHVGKDEIRRSLEQSQQYAPVDMTLSLHQIEVEGDRIRSIWTCDAPTFPHPMRGQDLWTIRSGQIHRLETCFLASEDA